MSARILRDMQRIMIWTIVCEIITVSLIQGEELKTLNLLGFLPMTGQGWTGGGACLPAALMAVRHVNERPGLLDDYNLTYTWADTQCNAGLATYRMFEYLREPPTKIMLLCCGCSRESEVTAEVSHLFNITQLSYVSSSPILSNRKRFPNFFRLAGPDQMLNPAKVAMMEIFSWYKVATINQAQELFSLVIDDFVMMAKDKNISIISQEIFEHDPASRVENLKEIFEHDSASSVENIKGFRMRPKVRSTLRYVSNNSIISQEIFEHDPVSRVENLMKHDARIIMTACYEDKARLILCHAYKIGLYGPKIVWFFYGWYSSEFWRTKLDGIPCTEEEMGRAADGAFIFGYYYWNQRDESGIAGLTKGEFQTLFKQEETYDPSKYTFEFVSGQCYDHIWVTALALNCTDTYLKALAHPKTLDEFTYKDTDMNDAIFSCMSLVSMVGIIGSIDFEDGADPIKNVHIERIQGGRRTTVGTYLMDTQPNHFKWTLEGISWKGGNIPRDSTLVTYEELSIPFELYLSMSVLSALGIATAVLFCIINLAYRNHKIVKLSSPNINNILLIGCVLTYSTVFMKTSNLHTPEICKAKIYCFSLGFTISFSALFTKTWRVYKIFTNKTLAKMAIKDYQLVGIICAMIGLILCVLITWEFVSPQQLKELSSEAEMSDNDAVVHRIVRVCYSVHSTYFEWTIYIVEGALLCFGAFLAFETRHVKLEALNDSHQIGMCIYNVVVLSAVGLTLTFLLENQVVRMYGVISGCVLFGTTTTQLIIFLPKVIAVYRNTGGDANSFQPNSGRLSVVPSEASTTKFTSVNMPK